MEPTESTITVEDILAAMEQTWTRLERVLEQFKPVLDAGPVPVDGPHARCSLISLAPGSGSPFTLPSF